MIQQLIIQTKKASLAFIAMLPQGDKSPIADTIRKMAMGPMGTVTDLALEPEKGAKKKKNKGE